MVQRKITTNFKLIKKLDSLSDRGLKKYMKIKKGKFKMRPMKKEVIATRMEMDETFSINYNKNLTAGFIREMVHLAKHYINLELAIFAFHQRSGKSSLGIALALFFSTLIGYKFTIKNDLFSSQHTFLSAVPNRRFNSIGVMDETHNIHAQIGSVVAEQELSDMQKIIAKELLHSIRISRNVALDTNAHYGLEPIALDYKNGQIKALIYDLEKSDVGYKQLLGYVIFPHYDRSVTKYNHFQLEQLPTKKLTAIQRFRLAYENKKDAWNAEVKYRHVGERAKERLTKAEELADHELFKACKNKAQRHSIARFILPQGYSEEEISEVVRFAQDAKILHALMEQTGVKSLKPHFKQFKL